jgi:hypothetical protein
MRRSPLRALRVGRGVEARSNEDGDQDDAPTAQDLQTGGNDLQVGQFTLYELTEDGLRLVVEFVAMP